MRYIMQRKLLIAFGFLAASTWLGTIGINQGRDLLGVAGIITALAAGILSLMVGFASEYKNAAPPKTEA